MKEKSCKEKVISKIREEGEFIFWGRIINIFEEAKKSHIIFNKDDEKLISEIILKYLNGK